MIKIINKKAQIAIWVVIAISIVAIIGLLFVFSKKPIGAGIDISDPKGRMEKCAKDAVNEAAEIILRQGGFVEPKNYKLYQNNKVTYLCENTGNFKPCINQHPLLLNEIKKEIVQYSYPIIEFCFNDVKEEFEKRKYSASFAETKLNISLGGDRIYLNIEKDIELKKNDAISRYEEFNVEINNPTYDLAKVAIEIAGQESKYCYFEYVGYMILYPRFDIKKFTMSDSTKIYTIKDKYSNKEMNIAIRGCAIPAGI